MKPAIQSVARSFFGNGEQLRRLFDARQLPMAGPTASSVRKVPLLLCLLLAAAWAGRVSAALDVTALPSYSPEQVHRMLNNLYTSGDMIELQSAAESVILMNSKGDDSARVLLQYKAG